MNTRNIADLTIRRNICGMVQMECDYFENEINIILDQLQPPILKEESFTRLVSSKNNLLKIVGDLSTDIEYIKFENPDRFSEYMNRMEEAVKTFFRYLSNSRELNIKN